MPFALAIIGILLLVTAIRGTTGTLFSLIKSDFTGSNNFVYWVVAILVIGSVGYVKKLQPLSDAFLMLVLVVLFISNRGFFSQFMSGLSASTSGLCQQTTSTGQTSLPNMPSVNGVTPNFLGSQTNTPILNSILNGQLPTTGW